MLFALALFGCGGPGYTYGGSEVWQLFPFDGTRTWEYISTDTSLSYKLLVTSIGEAEAIDGTNVYTLDYTTECVAADPDCVDGEILWKLRWSSDPTDGVLIHAFDVGAGMQDIVPPMQMTFDTMKKGEVAETTTGGANWTSTMLGTESCPIAMAANWEECGLFEVAVDAGDGFPMAGKWWATKGNGVAAMELATQTGRWELSDLACEPIEECDGNW